jgi:hypothetical protein
MENLNQNFKLGRPTSQRQPTQLKPARIPPISHYGHANTHAPPAGDLLPLQHVAIADRSDLGVVSTLQHHRAAYKRTASWHRFHLSHLLLPKTKATVAATQSLW